MYGYLRQDDSGHWYLIPEDKVNRFRELMEEINSFSNWEVKDALAQNIIDEFDQYRLGGGVGDVRIDLSTVGKVL